MAYQAEYSEYNDMNRFENLDSLETKVVQHLVYSQTKHAQNFWKLLKYGTLNALSQNDVSVSDRLALINNDSGYPTDKRVFLAPFIDDAWDAQCSSAYIFVDKIKPIDHTRAVIYLTVELITHSKVAVINGDGDPLLNPQANPNDSNDQDVVVVPVKNRETVLLKSILAELNGLYIDGVGYLQLNKMNGETGEVSMPLFNSRSFYGHSIKFLVEVSGVSGSGGYGY